MKKIFFVMFLLLLGLGLYMIRQSPTILSPVSSVNRATENNELDSKSVVKRSSLFVPYWGVGENTYPDEYDTYIYFGIIPGEHGINTSDPGYTGLNRFVTNAAGKRSLLTVRMLDSKQNFRILESTSLQEQLIEETLTLAKERDFEGIILDLEVSALPFDSLLKQISAFNKRFYIAAKAEELHYGVALYGDTFFRIRPFDVTSIGTNADEVLIMAYDFHKSRGNPGPNFPLVGKKTYGYDYEELISDFSERVPKEKLTVIFGYFGYDWKVDKDRNMVAHGEPLSYNQIAQRFLTGCEFTDCDSHRDTRSSEPSISYTDDDGALHIVWYEDKISVAKKEEFLQNKGIASFSYWAYTYF